MAVELLARLIEAGYPCMVIDTLRTPEEQRQNLMRKVSWTMDSKHLPQAPSGKSDAIDICPYLQFSLHGPDKLQWDSEDPIWEKIGEIGESLGLVWGGRWQKKDLGHFQHSRQKASAQIIAQSAITPEHWGEG